MLFVRERWAFAGCSAGHQEIDARVDLTLNQISQRRFVKRAVAAKWSDHCRTASCEHVVSPSCDHSTSRTLLRQRFCRFDIVLLRFHRTQTEVGATANQ